MTTTLPPLDQLASAAAQLCGAAHEAGDRRAENALNKAIWHLSTGLEIIPTHGGWLIPSGTRSAVVHRVSVNNGCSCEAGMAGAQCWHLACVEIIEAHHAKEFHPAPTYEEAIAAMNELFA